MKLQMLESSDRLNENNIAEKLRSQHPAAYKYLKAVQRQYLESGKTEYTQTELHHLGGSIFTGHVPSIKNMLAALNKWGFLTTSGDKINKVYIFDETRLTSLE